MKIIIYHHHVSTAKKYIHLKSEDSRLITFAKTINDLITVYPNEDIEGIILPSAVNNPEFGDILQRIYYHKLFRYKDGFVLVTTHTQFAEKIKEKYGIILE